MTDFKFEIGQYVMLGSRVGVIEDRRGYLVGMSGEYANHYKVEFFGKVSFWSGEHHLTTCHPNQIHNTRMAESGNWMGIG